MGQDTDLDEWEIQTEPLTVEPEPEESVTAFATIIALASCVVGRVSCCITTRVGGRSLIRAKAVVEW